MITQYILITGLLISIVSPIQNVHAAPISSHYVDPVIQRIDMALLNAQNTPQANNEVFIMLSWLDEISDAFVGLIDTENRLTLYEKNLEEVTPCLQIDILILRAKIEEISQELLRAQAEKRFGNIFLLRDILNYANTRYNHLIRGATDPQYTDYEFWVKQSFDPDTWCCTAPGSDVACMEMSKEHCENQQGLFFKTWESCSEVCLPPLPLPEENPPVCPFDTDYLPATKDGLGCDFEAIQNAGDQLTIAMASEQNAIFLINKSKEGFNEAQKELRELSKHIQGIVTEEEPRQSQPHIKYSGCNINEDAPSILPNGATRKELRGPFTVQKNHIPILFELEKLLREQGAKREQEASLVLLSERERGTQEYIQAIQRETTLSSYLKYWRNIIRNFFSRISVDQSSKNVLPFAQSIDSQQKLTTTFNILREDNKKFAELTSKKDSGIRKFLINYAFFLRRTCLYRPCNSALDRILRISLEDECFPYANGQYIHKTNSQPQALRCQNSADVSDRL
ncbi:MAG: hypothetical protein KAS32_04790 [Candidatus Peribacteraceae bacterium]|nr:hypothetical protein [Candidatus Peribacteraceae bacterium]